MQVSLVTTEDDAFQEILNNPKKDHFSKELSEFLEEREASFENKRVSFEKKFKRVEGPRRLYEGKNP